MGSPFYTFPEAGQRLGRSQRSLHDYVKKGLLKKRIENGHPALDKEEVELLLVELELDLPTITRRSFLRVESRLQKVEDEMRTVKHILELRDPRPMRPTVNHCQGLIAAVTTYLGVEDRAKVWTLPFLEQWADVLDTIDEVTLSELVAASKNPQAWIPFFTFCSQALDYCWKMDREKPSLAWQALAGRLNTTRRHFRAIIVTWIEMERGAVPAQVFDALETNRDALLKRLAKAG